MNQNKKLSTWYFLLIMSFTVLCTMIFLVMNKLERVATRLETRIYRRNLSYIVDKDYEVKKEKHEDHTIEVLNELTEFFYQFHENTVEFKNQLKTFNSRRNHVIYRFNKSSINIYDLTVVPNKEVKHYDLKEHVLAPGENAKDRIKQIPFSRQLKLKNKYVKNVKKGTYFICTARLAVSSTYNTTLYASFMSSKTKFNHRDLMPYKVSKTITNISMNKIMFMEDPRLDKNSHQNFRIFLKGYTDKLLRLHKVEAYCINFNDVNNEEVSKIE